MWIFIALLVLGALLYFLFHDTPDDRLRKAETAMEAGSYAAATEQINWLLEHQHPRAAATLARLFLTKARGPGSKGSIGKPWPSWTACTKFAPGTPAGTGTW